MCGNEESMWYSSYCRNSEHNDGENLCKKCAMHNYGERNQANTLIELKKLCIKRGFEFIGTEYDGHRWYVHYCCLIHGQQKLNRASFYKGSSCCTPPTHGVRFSYDLVKNDFEKRGYTLLSKEYEKTTGPLEFECEKHPGIIQKVTHVNLRRGHGCHYCKRNSLGEEEIMKWLESHKFTFAKEYTIPDFITDKKRNFRFDYAVFDSGNRVKALIEYQGRQHYEVVDWFGGKDCFRRQKVSDELKKRYCKQHKIPLIEIPYTEKKNIDKILTSKFMELSLLVNFLGEVLAT
jgi:hypothetical protein